MERYRTSRVSSLASALWLSGIPILVLASTSAAQTPTYVTGKVIDGPAGQAVAGESVSLLSGAGGVGLSDARTLTDGSFTLKAPGPGSYRVVAIGPGRRSVAQIVDLPAKGLDGITLELGPEMPLPEYRGNLYQTPLTPLRIHVVDSTGALVHTGALQAWVVWSPIPNASEVAPGHRWGLPFSFGGDPAYGVWSGNLRAAGDVIQVEGPPNPVPVVPCRVGIGVRSAVFGFGRLLLDAWPDQVVTVKLVPCPSVHVHVVNKAGDPVEGARVSVLGMDLDLCKRFLQGWASGTTGETGEVDIPSMAAGRYIVRLALNFTPGMEPLAIHPVEVGGDKADVLITYPDRLELAPHSAVHWLGSRFQPGYDLFRSGPIDDMSQITGERVRMPIYARVVYLPHSRMDAQGSAEPIHVSGKLVRDPGGPLPNVRMDICSPGSVWDYPIDATVTREDGSFDLSVPAAGDYTLRADQPQYLPGTRPIAVPAAGITGMSVAVVPIPTAILRLTASDGSSAGSGKIRVWARSLYYSSDSTLLVSGDGGAKLIWNALDPPGAEDPIVIGVQHDTAGWAEVRLPRWPDAPVSVKLQAGATLSCKVLDGAGKPQAGVTVVLSLDPQRGFGGPLQLLRSADGAGRVAFTQLPPGTYQLSTSARTANERSTQLVKMVTVEKANLEVTLQSADTLEDARTGARAQPAPERRTGGLRQER